MFRHIVRIPDKSMGLKIFPAALKISEKKLRLFKAVNVGIIRESNQE